MNLALAMAEVDRVLAVCPNLNIKDLRALAEIQSKPGVAQSDLRKDAARFGGYTRLNVALQEMEQAGLIARIPDGSKLLCFAAEDQRATTIDEPADAPLKVSLGPAAAPLEIDPFTGLPVGAQLTPAFIEVAPVYYEPDPNVENVF